ncbi:MAG: GTP-binding protein [Paludibacteraceae bacterium]|nr:GTP-binding protein [Paludibacteraceae bacterium]
MTNQIPVLLLTGYLGSGKTTLVNKILSNERGIKFAVIVNDIGEVNIDASLIQKGGVVSQQDDSLVALQNGCICCTLKMDLVKQLHDIAAMHQFDYIVIEASGICEPAPIAQTICSIPQMAPEYAADGVPVIDCIATVVDAARLKDEFKSGHSLMNPCLKEDDLENLVIQQIEFCNVILLNKANDVDKDELERIRKVIRAIQPKAEIIECDYCDIPLEKIIGTGLFDFDDVAGSAAWIQAVEGRDEHRDDDEEHEHEHDEYDEHEHEEHEHDEHEEHEHHHGHHHDHHHDHEGGEVEEYGITTFVYQARRPFSLNRFDDFVARQWPKSIIRAKGMCYFSQEYDTCYVFEQAGRQVSLRNAGQWYATMPKEELMQLLAREPELRKDWDEQYGDRMQRIVFIGQKLNKELIKTLLDDCLD